MLTVVFTTFNGQSKIRRTLDSLVRQKIESKWELLVVNNNSTDGTVSILEEYLDKLPLIIASYVSSTSSHFVDCESHEG